jgi:hypothetical protein
VLRWWWWFAVGCADGPTGDPCLEPEDTGVAFVCASDFGLEIGDGEGAFEPPSAGVLPLVRGSQGAQHVTIAVRAALPADELVLDRAMLRVTPRRLADGVVVDAVQLGVALVAVEDGVEAAGVQVVFPDASAVVDQEVELAVELAPVGLERRGHATRTGFVRWADSIGED